jgi:hypothetical protein
LGAALAAVSGTLIATLFPSNMLSRGAYELKSFVVTVLGAMGNPAGALMGGARADRGRGDPVHAGELDAGHRIRAVRGGTDLVPPAASSHSPGPEPMTVQELSPSVAEVAAQQPAEHRRAPLRRRPFTWLIVLVGLAFALLPAWSDNMQLRESLSLAAVYITLASSLNIMLGWVT